MKRREFCRLLAAVPLLPRVLARSGQNWPEFRGPGARGSAEGYRLPESWNADPAVGELAGIRWQTEVPGLSHGSPILWGDRIFLPTAVAHDGPAPIRLAPGGQPEAADDQGEQSWLVLCYDRRSGRELWRHTARRGNPRAQRHAKATHANSTLTTDGLRLIAFFGSEGLYCYDLDGSPLWHKDLGVVDVSKYGIGWGYGSSPSIRGDHLVLVCDDPDHPFVVCLRLTDGSELWRVDRAGVSERSWGTPLIHAAADRIQVVVNGWPWIVSYDLETGRELWRLDGGGDNPAPSPFTANGWIYITNAHGGRSPIYVVRPDAEGDITPGRGRSDEFIVWSRPRGGSYMSTPVVAGDYIFFGNTNGVVRCFNAGTGEQLYQERLNADAAIYASLVAGDGKIYCASENGSVYVLRAGPTCEILARNQMGDACYATPAISEGTIYVRTLGKLFAIA